LVVGAATVKSSAGAARRTRAAPPVEWGAAQSKSNTTQLNYQENQL